MLLEGTSFSLLASIQYEDMRAGLTAKISPVFVSRIHAACGEFKNLSQSISFRVVEADVRNFDCDVLLLKYASQFLGADLAATRAILAVSSGSQDPFCVEHLRAKQGNYVLVPSQGAISANHA